MRKRLRLWTNDLRGTTSIEYAILVALISCGIVVSSRSLGGNLAATYYAVANGFGGGGTVNAPPPATTNGVKGGGT